MLLHTSTERRFAYLIDPDKSLWFATIALIIYELTTEQLCSSFDLLHLTMSDPLATLCSADSTGDTVTDAVCSLYEVSSFDLHSSVPVLLIRYRFLLSLAFHVSHFVSVSFNLYSKLAASHLLRP
jgi:hypothetical protein